MAIMKLSLKVFRMTNHHLQCPKSSAIGKMPANN
jgi:hypothetical protein